MAQYNLAGILETHGPLTVAELSEKSGTHGFSLFRLLRALARLGIFQEVNPEETDPLQVRFAQTELSQALVPHLPASMYDVARMYNTDWHQHAWSVFAQSIATGEPGLRLHTGKDLWEYLREHPNEQEQFQRVMSLICHLAEGPILRSYDFSSFERVVDVAGGRGTLLLFERVIMPGPGGAYNTFFDLEVLALLEGQERTPYEYERLLTASGFRLLAVKPTPSSFSIVESIPL